jgi:hypothetical protein
MTRRVLILAAVALLAAASVGPSDRTTVAGSAPAPPAGLAGVTLPDDPAGLMALLGVLPTSVAGERANGPPLVAPYGSGLRVTFGPDANAHYPGLALAVFDVTGGQPMPEVPTVARFVEMYGREQPPDGDGFYWHVETAGWVGDLAWLGVEQASASTAPRAATVAATPAPIRPLYHLWWGHPGSIWLFGITADSPAGRDALLAAFVGTVRTGGLA